MRDEGGSGRLELRGETIVHEPSGSMRARTAWTLPVSQVRLIGEMTSEHGPFADDYFLCFAASAERWWEASFYAEGRDVFLDALGGRLGSELKLQLNNSSSHASNILWPAAASGRPMLTATPLPPTSPLAKLLRVGSTVYRFSPEALEVLGAER